MKRNRKFTIPVSKDIFDPPSPMADEDALARFEEQTRLSNRVEALVQEDKPMPIDAIQRESLLFQSEEKIQQAVPTLDRSLRILNIAAVIAGFFAVVAVLLIAGVVWEDSRVHETLRQSHFFKENPNPKAR